MHRRDLTGTTRWPPRPLKWKVLLLHVKGSECWEDRLRQSKFYASFSSPKWASNKSNSLVTSSRATPLTDRWSHEIPKLQTVWNILYFFVRARCLSASLRSGVSLADQRGIEPPPEVCQHHKSDAQPTSSRGRLVWNIFYCCKNRKTNRTVLWDHLSHLAVSCGVVWNHKNWSSFNSFPL